MPSPYFPLAQALCEEALANYFVRRSPEAAARLWAELLRLALGLGSTAVQAAAPAAAPSHPQLHFLSDRTTLAVMQRWPEDRVSSGGVRARVRVCRGAQQQHSSLSLCPANCPASCAALTPS